MRRLLSQGFFILNPMRVSLPTRLDFSAPPRRALPAHGAEATELDQTPHNERKSGDHAMDRDFRSSWLDRPNYCPLSRARETTTEETTELDVAQQGSDTIPVRSTGESQLLKKMASGDPTPNAHR